MKKTARWLTAIAFSSMSFSSAALAAPVTSLPSGTAVTIPATNQTTAGPVTFGPGIVFTSTTPNSVFGYTGSYGFPANGSWSGTSMIGLNASTGSFTLTFAAPIAAFLAEINWTTSNTPLDATMSAYDVNGALIESLILEHNGVNLVPVGFHGFSEGTSNIASIRFDNEYIGLRNISIASNAVAGVPEPATWAMMMLGFGAIGGTLRRRQKVAARIRFA